MGPAEAQAGDGARPSGAAAPLAPAPASAAAPKAAGDTDPQAERDERTSAIAAAWRSASSPLAEIRLLHGLHRATLLHVLQEGWQTTDDRLRRELTDAVEKCATAIELENGSPADARRMKYLIETAGDPWHHPVVKNIMRGSAPDAQQVLSWLREEGCTGALERLRQLCAAGGVGEDAALTLGIAVAPIPPASRILPAQYHCRALDFLLVLLLRARRTSDCISHIKAMEMRDAVALIGRLAARNKSNGRIWRHARDTALLCTQVLVATCMVRPIEEGQLGPLVARLASFYALKSEDLAPAFRKLLHSADTARHIYVVTQAIQHQFGESMRPFVCELYIRALTTGVNELERLKLHDEAGAAASDSSHQLADWFLSLAELLSSNPMVKAECVLTAFSLHPSKQYYQCVQDCSAIVHSEFSTLETDLHLLNLKRETNDSDQMLGIKSENVPKSLVSNAVLEGEGLGLSSDLCHDLVVLLSGPRLKMLTWDLSWDQLSKNCLSYMADTEEGTKHVTTELKYVHLDYTQFEIKEPEIHDVYFGIEKGYEHHLEIEEDDWSVEEDNIQFRQNLNDSDDQFESDIKKIRKKTPKKSIEQDDKLNTKNKTSRPKKEKKQKDRVNSNKIKNKMLTNHHSLLESDGLIDRTKYYFDEKQIYSQPQSTSSSIFQDYKTPKMLPTPNAKKNAKTTGLQTKERLTYKTCPEFISNFEASQDAHNVIFNRTPGGRFPSKKTSVNKVNGSIIHTSSLLPNIANESNKSKLISFRKHNVNSILPNSSNTNIGPMDKLQMYETSFENNQSTSMANLYEQPSNQYYSGQQQFTHPTPNWLYSQPVSNYAYNNTISPTPSYDASNMNIISQNTSYGYTGNDITYNQNNSALSPSMKLQKYGQSSTQEMQLIYNKPMNSSIDGSSLPTSMPNTILPHYQNSFRTVNNFPRQDNGVNYTNTKVYDCNNSSLNAPNGLKYEFSPYLSCTENLTTQNLNIHNLQNSNAIFTKSETMFDKPISTKEYKKPFSLHSQGIERINIDNFNHESHRIYDNMVGEENASIDQLWSPPDINISGNFKNKHHADKSRLLTAKTPEMEPFSTKEGVRKSESMNTNMSPMKPTLDKSNRNIFKSSETQELQRIIHNDNLILKSLLFGTTHSEAKQFPNKSAQEVIPSLDTSKKSNFMFDPKKQVETICTYAIDKGAIVHHQVINSKKTDGKMISPNKVYGEEVHTVIQASVNKYSSTILGNTSISSDHQPTKQNVQLCEKSNLHQAKSTNIQQGNENTSFSVLPRKSVLENNTHEKAHLGPKSEKETIENNHSDPAYNKFITELYSSVNAGSNNSHITSKSPPKQQSTENPPKKSMVNIKIVNAKDFLGTQDNVNKNKSLININKLARNESDICDTSIMIRNSKIKFLNYNQCQDSYINESKNVTLFQKSNNVATKLKNDVSVVQTDSKTILIDQSKCISQAHVKLQNIADILRQPVSNVINQSTDHNNDCRDSNETKSSSTPSSTSNTEIIKTKFLIKSSKNLPVSHKVHPAPTGANTESPIIIDSTVKVPTDEENLDTKADIKLSETPPCDLKEMKNSCRLPQINKIKQMKLKIGTLADLKKFGQLNFNKFGRQTNIIRKVIPIKKNNLSDHHVSSNIDQNNIKICKVSIKKIDKMDCLKIMNKNKESKINEESVDPEIIDNCNKGEVILISDSDNSDVEMVRSEDPIAIDNNIDSFGIDLNNDPIVLNVNIDPLAIDANATLKNLLPVSVPRLSFATIPNIINKNKNRNRKIPASGSLYVFSEGFSKHIKVIGIPISDQKKLQMSCCVELERFNKQQNEDSTEKPDVLCQRESILKLTNKEQNSSKEKQNRITFDNTNRSRESLSETTKKWKNARPRIIRQVGVLRSSRMNIKKNINYNDDLVRIDMNIVKDEIFEDIKPNEDYPGKSNNVTISKNNTKVGNNIDASNSDTLHKSVDMNSNFKQESKAKKSSNQQDSDISGINGNSEVNKSKEINSIPLPCPDLIAKSASCEYIVNYQEPDIIPKNCSNPSNTKDVLCNLNLTETCKSPILSRNEIIFKEPLNFNDAKPPDGIKTYHNTAYSKEKRKFELQSEQKVKKIKKDLSIDLPKTTQRKIGNTTHKLKINRRKHYDRMISFSVKQIFSNDYENDEYITKDLYPSINEENDFVADSKFNITDFLSKSDSKGDSRVSFYSPIFSDAETDIYKYAEQISEDESENFHEYILPTAESNTDLTNQKQGKGFGDWSGRGKMKDSLRGRQESPAAVLSDTFTTRPPLALHNFTNHKLMDNLNVNYSKNILGNHKLINETNNNMLQKLAKCLKNNGFKNSASTNENFCSTEKQVTYYKDGSKKSMSFSDRMKILSRVPGLDNLDFLRPPPSTTIVNVVQLGQLPVTSAQQTSLSSSSGVSQTTSSSFLDLTSTSEDYRTSSNEGSLLPSTSESNLSEFREIDMMDNANNQSPPKIETNKAENTQASDNTNSAGSQLKMTDTEMSFNNLTASNETSELRSQPSTNTLEGSSEKPLQTDFQQSVSQANYSENSPSEPKESLTEPVIENQIIVPPTTSTSFVNTTRAQALVNLLSQKIVHSPMNNQHVQMATFPKGTTINAMSLQQALAQILPPPLSQASNDGVIHSANHSNVNPQVLHIVQGKNSTQTSTFNSLLVDNTQQGVMNTPGTTQVLHIVQSKSGTNQNNSTILNQSQLSGTTFSGLSLVDANSQQGGNQVLHIVNAGMQNKNNTGTQVLKRVNLLTSITNPQGNNEQKMVQFVCKSADGKSIQLNAQPQRGMVLRLQPIDNAFSQNQKISESQISTPITTIAQSNLKTPSEQLQQELKSRSVYEENYAKFIQNSSNQIVPSSPEKSISLPKFNQAFGKSVFQENNPVPKTNESIEQIQSNPVVSLANDHQNSQDLNAVNLGQLGHISNPPLLIRKNPQTNVVHQNVVQQVKTSIAPMNIQTIHGGVIYTRQIPMNIGGTQTINLITVPSSDIIDEVQLQAMQKQSQDKTNEQQNEPQVIKLVSQDQQSNTATVCQTESTSEDANQSFTEQNQNNVSNHPLLTQMRIKVPMLSKGGTQMVSGARVVRPVLQIQRNIIPGTNPAVYQQLVLTTAPTIRQPVPNTVSNVRPVRPPSTPHQESNLSSSTLEQLREFDMVLEQVKERSTVQPGNNTSTFSNPTSQVTENSTEIDTPETNVNQTTTPLYSIGPNQTVNVTYVNQKVISKSSSVLTSSYATSDSIVNISSQNSPSSQISHGLTTTIPQVKTGSNTPTKINSKSIKTKPTKPVNPSTSSASKSTPVAAKTSLQKPLEDEQTTQRILYILAEYKEQVENSPDKDKPAPRRRSNPPTNPTTSTKRKKGSSSSSKKGSSGQSIQEMSPLGGEDAGHTMGSEDSSCGLSQGECTDNSIQGTENQSPQSSPQKSSKKILFQQDSDSSSTPIPQQQRNVIIADGQTITMARPGTGKTTAVLMPANYLLPMSMVKGSQQITIVTNQGPKILSVPHGEGGTTNALLVQRLISPAGLKPMLTRPGQIRHVRLPANAVQNLQAFNLNHSLSNQDSSWIGNNSVNNAQPKLVVEYSNVGSTGEINSDSLKTELSDTQTIKEEDVSGEKLVSEESTEKESTIVNSNQSDNALINQSPNVINDSDIQNIPEHILQTHVNKTTNNTLNLIQVHSLNADCSKLFSVQNSSNFGSLIQLSNKKNINQTNQPSSNHGLNEDNVNVSGIQDQSTNVLLRKQTQFDSQFLHTNKMNMTSSNDSNQTKISEITSHLEGSLSTPSTPTQTFILSHSNSHNEAQKSGNESHSSWSTNGVGSATNDPSPSFVNYNDSPHGLSSNQNDHTEGDVQESDGMRDLSESETTRVLRHPYSPSSSPPGPRHLYHKMFISTPIKKSFNSDMIDPSTSPMDEDKQYVQPHPKKNSIDSSSASSITSHTKNSSFTIHHHNPQVINLRHSEGKIESDVSGSLSSGRNTSSQGGTSTQHSAASLRHKYAVMEHELRLQKSLSEECEDLGVDSPSASDLFPEAELLYAASPSSQFDQSQDGCAMVNTNQVSLVNASPSGIHISPTVRNHDSQPIEGAEESEFARMHPNTTFHSGEIELVGDDANDAALNISFRNSNKSANVAAKRDVVRSVIEGIGNSSGSTSYQPSKNTANFSMVDLQRRTINVMSLQSSDDYSGAEDSMNSAESKEGIVNNKCLGEMLPEDVVKRDLNLSSAESSICISSGIIQRNVAQVIRHANSDQISLSESDPTEKLCIPAASGLSQNGGSFLLENSNDTRPVESGILKSMMLDRDGRDALTCSSPEQHSELFWESNSNSNQSEEQTPQVPPNLLDFSSEDSNKCCKSPISCEETNSTDSSSLGGHNNHTHRPLRINSVIKSSVGPSNAAEGPILHSALLSGTSNAIDQDISKKLPITLNSVHKSDSNTSSSPEEDETRATTRRNWARSFKNSGRRIVSPRSLSTEINIGAEIESSSSEGIPISSKPSAIVSHSGSSTPEEGSHNSRRVSLRGPGGIKRSCHCCGGTPTNQAPANLNSTPRRPRRKPPISH